MNVTIKDIAHMAGVSYSTVSKALNNSPLVKENTKKKIVTIAEQMGYEPNFAAQKLVSKQTKIIGLIWPTIERVFLSTLVTKISEEINKTAYSMILSVDTIESALNTFKKFQVDGIILFGEHADVQIKSPNIPLLSYGVAEKSTFSYPIIDANHEQAMEKAINYLYELNHRKIAYIGDFSTDDPMQREKYNGFKKAMKKYGLDISESNLVNTGGLSWFDGYSSASRLLDNFSSTTAIIGGSYDISGGVIRAAKERKLDIPGDISVISYDNIPQMANMEVPLTAIGVPIEQLANEIVQRIIRLIEGEKLNSPVIKMTPQLNKRKSCASNA